MRKALCFFNSLFICFLFANGQKTELIKVKGSELSDFILKSEYKFPSFTKGKVFFKSGEIASARLNFDYFNQAMKYIDGKGDTLAIANAEELNYIAFPADTFFYNKGYYEWVASSATSRLAVQKHFKVGDRSKVGAFGTSSPAFKVESHDAILEATTLNLDINEEITILKQTAYYISKIGKSFSEVSKNSFSSVFPKTDIEGYIKQYKLNLNKEEDVVDLFVYANRIKNLP